MLFILLLGLSALLVAGSAAYFSVLGIATLFAGSYVQVMIMAGALEFGKLVATSYLYRFWTETVWWLKTYLIIAVLTLMGITSLGVFGFLSAAYQVNSAKYGQVDVQIQSIESQKSALTNELDRNNKRIEMLNGMRANQEQRVIDSGNYKTPREQAYAAIKQTDEEIKELSTKNQEILDQSFKKDEEIIALKQEISKAKDIGTFKFISNVVSKPIDTVVMWFICTLITVFDPLAVALVLSFNIATTGKILKKSNKKLAASASDFVTQTSNSEINVNHRHTR